MFDARSKIADLDPELWAAICAEQMHRQQVHIESIASENHTSERVMAAQRSVLTNKDAEGVAYRVRGQLRTSCEQFPVYQQANPQPASQEARYGS